MLRRYWPRDNSCSSFSTDVSRAIRSMPKKLAVLGFSQGGVMAYSLALANPERFAALVALSSWLPPELVPHLSLGDSARSLPTLVQHGTEDSMIEVDRARRSAEILRQARIPLTYREYEMGHEIRPRSLSDLSAWLDEKVLSPSCSRNETSGS